jgi:hypothetical protein
MIIIKGQQKRNMMNTFSIIKNKKKLSTEKQSIDSLENILKLNEIIS